MTEVKDFDHLNMDLLVEMLDSENKGTVTLDRLLALANKLKKDRSKEKHTMIESVIRLFKATALLAVVILAGIFAFMEMESDHYEKEVEKNLLIKAEIELSFPVLDNITDILSLTSQYNEELDNIIRERYYNYTNVTLWDQLEENGFISTYAVVNPWKFENSAWFVFTIVTTIGYGQIVPITDWGRAFFIIYSIPSIISMAYFVKMLMNCYTTCPCKMGSLRTQVITLPLVFFIYLYISGWLFHVCEGWSVVEGVYFTWVTISTIGFGDYTPSDDTDAIENMIILFVIVNGLFMFSYAINVAANVIEYLTKPERWKEVFSRARLKEIELTSYEILPLAENSAETPKIISTPQSTTPTIGKVKKTRSGKTRRF